MCISDLSVAMVCLMKVWDWKDQINQSKFSILPRGQFIEIFMNLIPNLPRLTDPLTWLNGEKYE